jgi:hypothetical protein
LKQVCVETVVKKMKFGKCCSCDGFRVAMLANCRYYRGDWQRMTVAQFVIQILWKKYQVRWSVEKQILGSWRTFIEILG